MSMRAILIPASVILLSTVSLDAQATGSKEHAQHAPQGKAMQHEGMKDHMSGAWKEMVAFHALLAATYHPVAGKKDFQPLKAKADSLAAAARSWAASSAPTACASEETSRAVAGIAADAGTLAGLVPRSSDDELGKAIAALHEKFEGVEKKCGGHAAHGMKH